MRFGTPSKVNMRTRIILLAAASLAAVGCKSTDCGEGTVDRNGTCVPSNESFTAASCGPFTQLQGSICVPMFPPTVCDPSTTAPDIDATGVTTCIATGVTGCSVKLPCPTPAVGVQTVCGQIYDFETNQPFAQTGATGATCEPDATSGPCALRIGAYDALAFAGNPTSMPLSTASIDDCGRYSISNIPVSMIQSQILLVKIDDAASADVGPGGVTNPVGLTAAAVSGALKDFDAFVASSTTTAKWASSGGPAISTGILAAVYHGHSTGSDLAAGVTFKSFAGTAQTTVSYLSGTTRSTVDPALTATAQNGTALVTITNGTTSDRYYGQGGIDATCMWSPQPGLTIPNALLIESFRPISVPGMTCSL
jgi:hypothetical protein